MEVEYFVHFLNSSLKEVSADSELKGLPTTANAPCGCCGAFFATNIGTSIPELHKTFIIGVSLSEKEQMSTMPSPSAVTSILHEIQTSHGSLYLKEQK